MGLVSITKLKTEHDSTIICQADEIGILNGFPVDLLAKSLELGIGLAMGRRRKEAENGPKRIGLYWKAPSLCGWPLVRFREFANP